MHSNVTRLPSGIRRNASQPGTAGDYIAPPVDRTPTKLRIVRACLLQLHDGALPVRVEPGAVLTVARYIAETAADAGRGEIVIQ